METGSENPSTMTEIKVTMEKRSSSNLKWRSWSKNVAYLDLALISMGLPAGIICVIMGVDAGIANSGSDQLPDDQKERIKKAVVTMTIIIMVCLSSLGIWAAIKLMSASEIGRDPRDALKMAQFWKNVNLLFIGLALVGMFLTPTFFTSGVNLMWHLILLYIVCQYIHELEVSLGLHEEEKLQHDELSTDAEYPNKNDIV